MLMILILITVTPLLHSHRNTKLGTSWRCTQSEITNFSELKTST